MTEATPIGTRRRVRALYARGWDAETLAEETGVHPDLLDAIARTHKVQYMPVLAQPANEHIAAAYNRIGDRHPAGGLRQQVSQFWPPPAAWDDDQLDLPEGEPAKGWRRQGEARLVQGVAEEARFFREYGGYRYASSDVLATRLGTTRNALTLALRRDAQRQTQHQPQMEAC